MPGFFPPSVLGCLSTFQLHWCSDSYLQFLCVCCWPRQHKGNKVSVAKKKWRLCVYKAHMGFAHTEGVSESSCVLHKATIRRAFIYTEGHFRLFLQVWGTSWSPYTEGLCTYRGGFVYTYIHTHLCTFWSFFLHIWGYITKTLYRENLVKHLYWMGFAQPLGS